LGHRSLVVYGREGVLLVDPLFGDTFDADLRRVAPRRALDLGGLPTFDAVLLTGRGADHFDASSLAQLPRDAHVLMVDDRRLGHALDTLGFSDVFTLAALTPVSIGTLLVAATRECGLVFFEGESTLWHLAATRPRAGDVLVESSDVHTLRPRIDLALLPWPFDGSLDDYGALLANAVETRAQTVASVGGWTFADGSNPPGPTLDRFVSDLQNVHPPWRERVVAVGPGDSIELEPAGARMEQGTVPFCLRLPDEHGAPPPFPSSVVERASAFTRGAAGEAITELFDRQLASFVQNHPARFEWHARWGVCHEIEVAFCDGSEAWTVDFADRGGAALRRGRSEVATGRTSVAASALLRLVAGSLTWEQLLRTGLYRCTIASYRVDRTGLFAARPERVPDPLAVVFGDG
jgi:hypothetical protein